MNEMPQRTTVGIPWFIREDYDTFRLLIPHRAWHTTFDQWLAAATQVLDQQQRAGVLVFKVEVQSDGCRRIRSASRASFRENDWGRREP